MLKLAAAALREIFDESAYDRFLATSGLNRSASSYAAFLADQEKAKLPRPRCC